MNVVAQFVQSYYNQKFSGCSELEAIYILTEVYCLNLYLMWEYNIS